MWYLIKSRTAYCHVSHNMMSLRRTLPQLSWFYCPIIFYCISSILTIWLNQITSRHVMSCHCHLIPLILFLHYNISILFLFIPNHSSLHSLFVLSDSFTPFFFFFIHSFTSFFLSFHPSFPHFSFFPLFIHSLSPFFSSPFSFATFMQQHFIILL